MPLTPFLILSDKWAVGADDLQWMLARRKGPDWRPVSFVACTKAVLLRCIHEKGAIVTQEGQAALDALPDTFRAWRERRFEASDSAVGARLSGHSLC